ncbi:MAG: hypothetical protein N2Z70_03805 [Bdellovibrionaceae bacterium]|jgi:hypothetical protein|nr:hypothetical protein [Pseudobdellovibrionaceae bacterium]
MKSASPQSLKTADNKFTSLPSSYPRGQQPAESIQQLALQLEEWEQLVKEMHYFLGEIKIWAKPQRKV